MGNSLDIPTIKKGDWVSVRQAIQKLALKLGPTSEPIFANVTPTGLTASKLVATNSSKKLVSTDLYSWVTQTANQVLIADDGDGTITFSLPQDIHTGASPTFAGLTLSSIAAESSDVDKFLVDSTGVIKYRTGSEVLSDIGGQAQGDVLDDLNTLGANTADGEFLVGTGAGALAWESAYLARISMGLGAAATPTYTDLILSTPVNIYALSHDSFADFVAAKHYDWTNETHNLLTSGSLQGSKLTLTIGSEIEDDGGGYTGWSGDGAQWSGLGINIPQLAGSHFYYGWGGTEEHYFGNAGELHMFSDGTLVTTGRISVAQFIGINTDNDLLSMVNNALTVNGTLTATGALTASNYTAANLLTACATNAGALDFSAASKTLTVEDNAIVSQDYSSDATPRFERLGLGTNAAADKMLFISKASSSIVYGAYLISQYTGSGSSGVGLRLEGFGRGSRAGSKTCFGGYFNCYAYDGNFTNPPNASTSAVTGGLFIARDYTGKTYTATGTGKYEFRASDFRINNAAGDWTTNNPPITTYGTYIAAPPTGYGSNHIHWSLYSVSGNSYFGGTGGIAFGQIDRNERITSATATTLDLYATDSIELHQATNIGDGTNETQFAGDGTVTFAGTARINWTKITANGVTLGDGPPTSTDSVSDLQTANDGNTYTANEIAANAGQNLIVDFTGVTAFNWVRILMRYAGQSGHSLTIQLEITPFDDSAWHTFDTVIDQPANQNMEDHSFFIPDDVAYINSGVVKIRIIHEMAGNANDDWVIDEVALYQ